MLSETKSRLSGLSKAKSRPTGSSEIKSLKGKKAVGVFGGTFDPIHIGHLITAQSVLEMRNLKKIIFVPAYISPFKQNTRTTEGKHRLEMIRISIKENNFFEVSDFELKNKDVSYTIDTLKFLKKKYDNIELIIGYDNIFEFHKWKDPDKIIDFAKLVVLKRKTKNEPKRKDKFYKQAEFLETPIIEISSTDIRERVKNKLSIDFLVTPKVKDYIFKHNIFKD
jgi:nicotinate-nucleotide adenylyltransferase